MMRADQGKPSARWWASPFRLLALLALFGMVAAGCGSDDDDSASEGTGSEDAGSQDGGDGEAGEPQPGGTVTYAFINEPRLLDPIATAARKTDQGHHGFAVFGSLMRTSSDLSETEPYMAESLTSEDGTVWTLTLREGIEFTDGTPYDADAVKFNWDRFLAESVNANPAADAIETIEVVDPLTLRITLSKPLGQFPTMLGSLNFIGSPTAIQELGDQFGNEPVGAGPFVLEEWVRGSHARFSKNPNFFLEGQPYLDELVILTMPDPDARLNALLTGEADAADGLSPADVDRITSAGGYYEAPDPHAGSFGGGGWVFNSAKPPFDDKQARCAMIQAIDFEQVNQQLAAGNSTVPTGFFNEPHPLADPDRHYLPYDPEAAQAAFDELAADGTPLSFDFITLEHATVLAEAYQTQLATYDNVEMTIDVQAVPDAVGATYAGDHQLIQLGLGAGDIPPAAALTQSFHTIDGAPNPFLGYGGPEVDALLETALTTLDDDERAEALIEIEEIIIDECLYRSTPSVNLGPSYNAEGLESWNLGAISVWWDEVWVSN